MDILDTACLEAMIIEIASFILLSSTLRPSDIVPLILLKKQIDFSAVQIWIDVRSVLVNSLRYSLRDRLRI